MPPHPTPSPQNADEEQSGTVLETEDERREPSAAQGAQIPVAPPVDRRASEQPSRPYHPTARPPVALLTVLDDGRTDGELIRIRADRFVIGRSEGDFRLPHDMQVSARHVEILRYRIGDRYRWVITDLQTPNGLFIRVSRTALADQAEFLVGSGRYRFEAVKSDLLGSSDSFPSTSTRPPAADPSAARQPAIVELAGDKTLFRFPLTGREYWIGRDSACAICRANDPFVEARHACLSRDGNDAWHARNNKSANGLWYRVPQITVDEACLFQIGEQRFRLRIRN
jgi:pSer/pThr/pTyr-binding forkhead associated (FHA) protein